jgi:uncharacterized membrane protein YdjX (TVP38/TMEM64 family)
MRDRKPWRRLRTRLLGWKVLFTSFTPKGCVARRGHDLAKLARKVNARDAYILEFTPCFGQDTRMTQNTGNDAPKAAQRIFVLGLFLSGLAAFFYFDLGAYLSYAALAENEEFLRRGVAAHRLPAAAIYVGVYIVAVALSLPGAIWLTLSGGLLFGVWLGGTLAVLGAGTGAAVMFLMAKYVLGDTLRSRFGARLTRFEAAFNRDAWSYLLVLRLLPVFPFFLVNLGAALIGVRFSVFALTTYIGIIPGAFVYASVGNGISVLLRQGAQPDLSLIGRPEIFGPLVGFAVLALAPVIWRRFQNAGAQ